jgi:hypothetical protein
MPDLTYQEPGVAEVDAPELPEMRDVMTKLLWETRALKLAIVTAFNLNSSDFVASNFADDPDI